MYDHRTRQDSNDSTINDPIIELLLHRHRRGTPAIIEEYAADTKKENYENGDKDLVPPGFHIPIIKETERTALSCQVRSDSISVLGYKCRVTDLIPVQLSASY